MALKKLFVPCRAMQALSYSLAISPDSQFIASGSLSIKI